MSTKTFPIAACLPVIYSGGSGVNAGDLHIPLGEWAPGAGTGWNTRVLLKASLSFAGMTAINEARLYVYQHTAGPWHAKGSGSVLVDTRRKTADWSEASGGGSTATDETWGGSSGTLASGSFADDGDGNGGIDNGAADAALDYIPLTNMVRAWFAGSPNYGLLLYAVGTAAADACELYSRRSSGKVPYIWIDYETNAPPLAPYDRTPAEGDVLFTGRTITYSGRHNDVGNMTAYELQVFLTDHATLIQSVAPTAVSGVTSFARALTLPAGYNANRQYGWRARTKDDGGLWSPWSPFADFRADTVPATPAAPGVETDTLTPTISGTAVDPDPGDFCNAAQVEVERVSNGADMWTSPTLAIAGSPWSTPYAGTPLAYGTQYRARIRVRDQFGAYSSWSAWTTWTPTMPVGPTLTPRSTAAKQNTLTPTLKLDYASAFTNDDIEVYVSNDLASTRLWNRTGGADYGAVVTKSYPYAGTALSWGGVYYWRARVKVAGVMSAWSALVPFRINAVPTAPTITVTNDAGTPAVTSPAGVLVTTDTTPVLVAPFADPDVATDGDTASARSIEVRRKDTGAALAGYPKTDAVSTPHTIATALAADVVFEARIGYRDAAGQPAGTYAYSAWRELKASTAPAVTLTAPAAGASVTDSTPLLDWSFAAAAGKTQSTWQVLLFDRGPLGALFADEQLIHDSGVRNGTATAYDVPAGVVVDDHEYRWEVHVTDTDGLPAVLA